MPPKKTAASKKEAVAAAAAAPVVPEEAEPASPVESGSPKKATPSSSPVKPSPEKKAAKKPAVKKAAPAKATKAAAAPKEDKPKPVKKAAAPRKKSVKSDPEPTSSGAESSSPQKSKPASPTKTASETNAAAAPSSSPAKKKPAAKKRTKSQADENGTASEGSSSPVKKAKAAPKAKAATAAKKTTTKAAAAPKKTPTKKTPSKKAEVASGAEGSAAEETPKKPAKKKAVKKKADDAEEGATAAAPAAKKSKKKATKEEGEASPAAAATTNGGEEVAPAEKKKRVRKPKPVPEEDDAPVVGQRKGFKPIPLAKPKLLKKMVTSKSRAKATSGDDDEGGSDGEEEGEAKEKTPKATGGKKLLNAASTDWDSQDFQIDGQYKLKIASWNISGLRAWLEKGGKSYLQYEHPDIVCLQETKCKNENIPDTAAFTGYHPYWLGFGGQAGVGIYSRQMPLNVTYGIGDKEMDEDGRLLTAEYEKFFLVNVYVPNSGRKLVTLGKRMRWNVLFKEYIQGLDKKKAVIICGDMNVAHEEIDLANPKSNKKNAGFTQEERDGMTDFLTSCDFVDTFRHFYPKLKDQYTFWTYMSNARAKNVGWRLDYILVSGRIIDKVVDNKIRNKVYGSDHCPIVGFFNL